MATINTYGSVVFKKINERDDVTIDDIAGILSKMTNIVEKLMGLISASSWHGHDEMVLYLQRCNQELTWGDNINYFWSQYIDILKRWPNEPEFEEKQKDLQRVIEKLQPLGSMNPHIPRYAYTSSIMLELKHLFYTECFNILNTENITKYDTTNTVYKWPGEPPKIDIDWDDITEKYEGTATDEIIDLTLRQQNLLTCGYISNLNIKNQIIPSAIIYLCLEYVKFVNFRRVPHENDPVNFVTVEDLKQCEIYRKQGNEYFKLKQYKDAITKYTKSLFYNNDNHLVHNNLSLSYFSLNEYNESKISALDCIKNEPSYVKGWVRLSMTCQQLTEYDIAFICIMVAYCISIKYNKKFSTYKKMKKSRLKASGICHKLYSKIDELMVDNLAFEDQLEIETQVSLFFETDRYKTELGWQQHIMHEIMEEDEEMKQFHEECIADGTNDKIDIEYVTRFQNHAMYAKDQVFFNLYQLYLESRWNNKKIMNDLKHEMCLYNISYMSLKNIMKNKRWFGLNFNETSHEFDENGQRKERSVNICGKAVCGKPNAERMIKELLRVMAQRGYKPRWIFVAWRMRNEFKELKEYFEPLKIQLTLESEADAKKNAYEFGNDHDGWNHMIWE